MVLNNCGAAENTKTHSTAATCDALAPKRVAKGSARNIWYVRQAYKQLRKYDFNILLDIVFESVFQCDIPVAGEQTSNPFN